MYCCKICVENFLLPGLKVLANSLKNTCKGFHFCSNIAGWKQKALQKWTPSQVFVKDFARIFSNFRRFVRVSRNTYQVQHPLGINNKIIQLLCNATILRNKRYKPTHMQIKQIWCWQIFADMPINPEIPENWYTQILISQKTNPWMN